MITGTTEVGMSITSLTQETIRIIESKNRPIDIKVFSKPFSHTLRDLGNELSKKLFSNPDKIALIYILDYPPDYFDTGILNTPELNVFKKVFKEENIITFNFSNLTEEEYKKLGEFARQSGIEVAGVRFKPMTEKEASKLVEFVDKKVSQGIETFFIVDEKIEKNNEGNITLIGKNFIVENTKSVAISIAYAVAKYILEDKLLAEHFDASFFEINNEIVEKIKKAYIQHLKWELECSTFTYGTSRTFAKFTEHIFNKETNKSFCGLFEAETKLCKCP